MTFNPGFKELRRFHKSLRLCDIVFFSGEETETLERSKMTKVMDFIQTLGYTRGLKYAGVHLVESDLEKPALREVM